MTDADVIVVGGSVAGATTACFLARRGRRVILLDRALFPRAKPCGEGLMPHGVDVLADLDLAEPVRALSRELLGVRYALVNGETAVGHFQPGPRGGAAYALGIRRLDLDVLLLNQARAHGVDVVECFRVRTMLMRDGRVVGVSDGARSIRAPIVVGADGLRSTMRGLLGWGSTRSWPRRWAVAGHLTLPSTATLAPEVLVMLAPGAEAYLTPLSGNEALLAVLGGRGLMASFKGDLCGGFARAITAFAPLAPLLDGATVLPGVRATGPFAARARRVAGNGALLVGDAAGFLDPITGEGMASALLQARAAARVIDRALASGRLDLTAYADAHRRITRTGTLLTWTALGLCASTTLSTRALRGLQQRPALFDRLLAINCGRAGLGSLTPRDWLALVAGR